MAQAGLSYEQAPPVSVPFRFFLTAPVFGLLCAGLLVWRGPEVFDSRWMPAALGATHLLTLGFLASVMTGAMMQILPVLVGAPIPAPRGVARLTHLALSLGTLSLAGGFVLLQPTLLRSAVVLLGAGFALFVIAVVVSLARVRAWNATVGVMWLVAIALAVTVVFGALLAASLGFGIALPTGALHDLHPGWALLGWVGVLVIGVAYQVVPMFQMTPSYSDKLTSWLTWAIFAALVLWTAAKLALGDAGEPLAHGLALAVAAGYATFAVITLDLQRQRRRRLADVTLDFWRVGMVCLIAAACCWAARLVGIEGLPDAFDVFVGVLAIVGVALSVVNGMLYKIAPFLVWFHLQTQSTGRGTVPHMKKILGDDAQRTQFRVQLVALALLLAAPWWTPLAYPGGLALAASMILLLRNLLAVTRIYREVQTRADLARDTI
ncbi:MAG: cbb3-type cytochrome c oxidase subunit I [Betaproteobacteria bacterium]|jgi:hypothetical protein|nr:cbb3-type cytochrome c oxidase subunit I [Betaproteobacteria bacterium]